jgi:hypothetical protein
VATFKDNKDRSWTLTVDTVVIRHVASRLDGLRIDRLYEDGAKGLMELMGDPVRVVDVLWVMCEKQAKERTVTDESFGESLVGDFLDLAAVALHEALASFFPSQRREVATALLAKGRELEAAASKEALEAIANLRHSKPATTAAGSSDSTPEVRD